MGGDADAMGNGCEERRGPTWFRSLAEGCCVRAGVVVAGGAAMGRRATAARLGFRGVAAACVLLLRGGCCAHLAGGVACVWRREMERDGVQCKRRDGGEEDGLDGE
ncbi:hypothetical protein MRB53_002290 [Persea americana]|uniref:Uncharacterized protein n=1 Tax=Persea americana TaxID=3435 RepID=A0ACC2MU26_PERAE|nr:hypothetical protein MRB53_002290 [Persea americana]